MTMEEKRRVDEFSQPEVEVEDAVTIDGDLGFDEIPDIFWRVLNEDKKLKATWEGERKDLKDKTRSGYDMALANLLMPYNFRDGEVGAILRVSPSGKREDGTMQYLSRTVTKAKVEWMKRKQHCEKEQKEVSHEVHKESQATKAHSPIKTKTLIPDLVHLVRENGAVKYLLKKDSQLYVKDIFTLKGVKYRPKQDLPIRMPGPDILTDKLEADPKVLLNDVTKFIESYLELPHDSDYLLLALWVLHTYFIEKFMTTPILYFYGVKETGKSRAGEVLAELAFWCERLTSPTQATLFREAHYFRIALIIDEIRLWGAQGNKDLALLVNSRYKRGIVVPRVNMNIKGGEDQIEYFDVFGPLAICTTETIPDTLQSRSITFLMQKNAKVEVEKLIDQMWAENLRNRLTILRARYLNEDLPETDQIARRRLNEITMPLYQILMFVAPGREKEFKETVTHIEKKREEEEGFSLEAEIVEEILIHTKQEETNTFLTTDIVERLNQDRPEKGKLSDRLVSIRIARLGFQKARLTNGRRGFLSNPELLKRLALQYSLDTDRFRGAP